MRIGIDFDNTIICYDQVFCDLAKSWNLVAPDFQGSKKELRDKIRNFPEGDIVWQRMQGKAYGELISKAEMFSGFKDFISACHSDPNVEIFIVSHKTEFGHFDENQVKLRDAARLWLQNNGLFNTIGPCIQENNVFFETTREEKIERIKSLKCTHFIDDLVEVLYSDLFPNQINRFLFQPLEHENHQELRHYTSWQEIKNAIFPN